MQEEDFNGYYINFNDVGTSRGFGRIITKDYVFDGVIDPYLSATFFGRVIWTKTLDSFEGDLYCMVGYTTRTCYGTYFL